MEEVELGIGFCIFCKNLEQCLHLSRSSESSISGQEHFALLFAQEYCPPCIVGDYRVPDRLDCLRVSLHPPHLGFRNGVP